MISVSTNRRFPLTTWGGLLAAALILAVLVGAASAASASGPASAAGVSGVPGASDAQTAANETTLTVGDATVEPHANDTVRLSLDRVPEGLAGFEVTLAFDSNATGSFTGARYPEDYQPTTDPAVGESGRTITLEAADLGNVVTPGATNVTLAYVSVTGQENGTAKLTATELQVDADGGSKVRPAVEAGTLSVGSAASGGGSGSAGSAGQQGSSSGATGGQEDAGAAPGVSGGSPGLATVLQIGAVVAVAGLAGLGLFVWRD
ncbi:hypothetical protein SAMN05216559_3822 [Halomicrobium zhouii]|uniref:Cohesin domain-containing protein n=1 Tax=Halomicrobium zhouii TaxID=767519 RepID=A0A1I6M6C5_9EURY|nr:hypothetical protein [Halomicrobium zhouii]SFS11269.1 hypothetical protein SAMN05216559_3822 [Halomicrobium zhouii]